MSRDERAAKRKPGSLIRHVRVVPHQQAVLVSFAESCRSEPGIDAYGAVVCVSDVSDMSFCGMEWGNKRGKLLLLAVGSMYREWILLKPLKVQ